MAKQSANNTTASLQAPTKGMNRDAHVSQISETEYTFMLNGNFQDEHGLLVLQNEGSNILCSNFKTGFKVIGHKYDINGDRVYFFLVNPATNVSEIGYIPSIISFEEASAVVDNSCECNLKVTLETPLEDQTQVASCEYVTILSDYCDDTNTATRVLNFNIDYPIYKTNIHIKYEKLGKVMYFTDGYNPPRYIKLGVLEDNPNYYNEEVDCYGNTIFSCAPLVDKMRVFKLFNKPCLKVGITQDGGSLRAGMYEAVIAYCDNVGNEMSNYYSLTNPIAIHDKNNNILDQTNLNYITNKSFSIAVSDLDDEYEYFKIVIIYRSGLDGAIGYYEYNVYTTDTTNITISHIEDKQKTTLQDILAIKPQYHTSKGMAEANGYLFQYGLTEQRELNLQPVVNFMGAFAKWITVQAKEDLYERGESVANYKSYMRDEVYPYSIKFFMDGGYETPNYVFIPRPAKENEIITCTDGNATSINAYTLNCEGVTREKYWQFHNTATVDEEVCVSSTPIFDSIAQDRNIKHYCTIADNTGVPTSVASVASGFVEITTDSTLVDYINDHIEEIKVSTNPQFDDIKYVLNNPNTYTDHCSPEFSDVCDTITQVTSESKTFALEVGTVSTTETPAVYADYERVPSTSDCLNVTLDTDGVTPIQDTVFMNSYMPGFVVYAKTPSKNSNNKCTKASKLMKFTGGTTSISSFSLLNFATPVLGAQSELQDSVKLAEEDLANGFTDHLHISAVWFKGDFPNSTTKTIVELGELTESYIDIMSGTAIRVTVYNDCTSTAGIYSRIITDLDALDDTNKFIELDPADFTGTKFYVAIDSPLKDSPVYRSSMELNNSNGEGKINITTDAGTITTKVTLSGTTDSAQLVIDYEGFYGPSVSGVTGAIVRGSGRTIYFWTSSPMIALTWTDQVDSLNGTPTLNEQGYVLTPPPGCLSIYQRDVVTKKHINFTDLTFGKQETYTATCHFNIPILGDCEPVPYQKGKFSYWESTEKYPCNTELFNSQTLNIRPSDLNYIPTTDKDDFEAYYTSGTTGLNYNLTSDTNFVNQQIRHYKYPDSTIAPFMSPREEDPGDFKSSVIYPIGFHIDNSVINTFLDIAVNNNLMTLKERQSINKYEIYRGDRRVNRSVIAKGLLFDVYESQDILGQQELYANYPLNTLGKDIFNNISHPGSSAYNNRFTFHSPETHFYKPTLPKELAIEGYMFGKSNIIFDQVKDHSSYVLLGDGGYALATGLALAEAALEVLTQVSDWTVLGGTGGNSSFISIAAAVVAATSFTVAEIFKTGQYRLQWIKTIEDLGKLTNFAYFQTAVGFYNNLLPNSTVPGISNNSLKGLSAVSYLKEGLWNITDEHSGDFYKINNLDREDSVFLSLGSYNLEYPSEYSTYDNTQYSSTDEPITSRRGYSGIGRSSGLIGNAASPYVSLKTYNPSQYGTIDTIDWRTTGFCGDLSAESENCDVVLGGDIFISRFSLKRKFPFFTTTAFGLAPLIPFKYSSSFNINAGDTASSNRYYIDYHINGNDSGNTPFSSFVFPSNRSKYRLDGIDDQGMYVEEPSKFYLYSYGIPHFLVESEINCNFRYAKRENHENFYPNIGDVSEWTQERNVSIREPNTYFYNPVYSSIVSRNNVRMLPFNYSKEVYDKLSNLKNGIIYSKQGLDEYSLMGSWLNYKPNDFYQFDQSYGDLVAVTGIESEKVIARFTNGVAVFNAEDKLSQNLTANTKALGAGGIFTTRSVNFNKTELGYGGTQHRAEVSCDFGHFWADAKRGKIFQVAPGGGGLSEITAEVSKWFRDNLPFKIKQHFPEIDIDNAFKDVGLIFGWDERLRRLIVIKKDYKLKNLSVTYQDGGFYLNTTRVYVTDPIYFEDHSWTIAYSPETKAWVSYYSYKPNYFVEFTNYFQTGVNYSNDVTEIGLWSHLPFLGSYQVFYGKRYPFIVEYALGSKYSNSVLQGVDYYLDVRKYYSKWDFADGYGIGFNKINIYNNYQNTGDIELAFQNNNDFSQSINYPKFNGNSITALQSEINGKFSFNYIYNCIRNERSGLPVWKNDPVQVMKSIDASLVDYRNNYKDRLRGDYFSVRLTNDIESRYKFLFRLGVDERQYYEQ